MSDLRRMLSPQARAAIVARRALGSVTDWPEEKNERLRQLWDEGHSAAEIGRRLGVTKNAVCGKARRLDLPPRASPIGHTGVVKPRAPKRPTHKGSTLPPLLSLMVAPRLAPRQQAALGRRPPMPVAVPAVPVPPLTPPNRSGDGCQWTDSNRRPWVFCNAHVAARQNEDGSWHYFAWCPAHLRRVYTARPALVAEAA